MKRMDTINVIPFIDIMLVLLAIVLTTATFIVEGRLDIRLPKAEAGADSAASEPFELVVDADGQVYSGTGPLAMSELAFRLDALAKSTPIVLRVDEDAKFANFVAVVDQLKSRALERLTIVTRRQ
jgi:biopolymer transport protein ExbD